MIQDHDHLAARAVASSINRRRERRFRSGPWRADRYLPQCGRPVAAIHLCSRSGGLDHRPGREMNPPEFMVSGINRYVLCALRRKLMSDIAPQLECDAIMKG